MSKYKIPPAFENGFLILSKLSSKQVLEVSQAINSAPMGTLPEDFSGQFKDKLKLTQEDAEELFNSIFSTINFISSKKEVSVEDFASDISYSFENDLDATAKDAKKLFENLLPLLKSEGKVLHTVKAFDLLLDNERVYDKSRVISDVRLVFDDEISEKVLGAVVVHQLRITYSRSESETDNEFYVSMDVNDLNELKESIERALKKDRVISTNKFTKDLSFIGFKSK